MLVLRCESREFSARIPSIGLGYADVPELLATLARPRNIS